MNRICTTKIVTLFSVYHNEFLQLHMSMYMHMPFSYKIEHLWHPLNPSHSLYT